MKKLFLFAIMATLIISSCQKDELDDDVNGIGSNQQCNCGIITDDEITSCYTLTIKNDCSGNYKVFCCDYTFWLNNFIGDRVCVTNQPQW